VVEPTEVPPSAPEAAPPIDPFPDRVPGEVTVRQLLEVGAHFGHQTRRWDPRMKKYIYGERNGVHILDLDLTVRQFRDGLEFLRETVAAGGKVLFVATKRQAQGPVKFEAERSNQYYVNNRWLGGMLTNFRTVKRSIERFKDQLELVADEEKVGELTKKELSRVNRSNSKYKKSLDGIREMSRLPDAMFVIDLKKEHIAISEARRLGIPIVGVVDTNCSPEGIDFVIPANDDAIRAVQYYCALVADVCLEGEDLHNERIQQEVSDKERGRAAEGPGGGRRVVEIKQAPRRGRGTPSGRTHSAEPRPRRDAAPAEPAAEPAAAAPAAAPTEAAAAPAAAPAEAPAAPAAAPAEAPAAEASAAEASAAEAPAAEAAAPEQKDS